MPLSMWSRFKDWATGMTEEERDLYRLEERIWHLEKILQWNAEIGKRHFNEEVIRAEIAELKKVSSQMRRRLPADSKMKRMPFMIHNPNPYYELESHINYLRDLLRINRMDPNFPLVETTIRLRILEEQRRMMAGPPPVVVMGNSHCGPHPASPPGYGPPVPVGPAVPINPWAPAGPFGQ